jgi:hypothetical protein
MLHHFAAGILLLLSVVEMTKHAIGRMAQPYKTAYPAFQDRFCVSKEISSIYHLL